MGYFNVVTIAPRENDPLFNPYLRVCLAQSPDSYEIVKGRIVFGHKLMGIMEIDEAINWLIEDLEKVRKKAKRDLEKAQKNRFKSVSDKRN